MADLPSVVVAPAADAQAPVEALISYLEHDPQPMIVLDTEYNILAANTAYRRQFGAVDRPYIGHKCYRISHHYDMPCDRAGEHCPMRKARETMGPNRVLHIHHTPRGPEHVDVELRPILNARCEVVAFVERRPPCAMPRPRPARTAWSDGRRPSTPRWARCSAWHRRCCRCCCWANRAPARSCSPTPCTKPAARRRPLVVVDCSGLTETLFESELFGYEKGAFTGAVARKKGLVETAQGGTLFLDEIGDVPLSMQVKLLRLIESGTFRRVGSVDTQQADFRPVAATHKPLEKMVAEESSAGSLLPHQRFPGPSAAAARLDDIPLLVDSSCSAAARRAPPERGRGRHGAPAGTPLARQYPRAAQCAGARRAVCRRQRDRGGGAAAGTGPAPPPEPAGRAALTAAVAAAIAPVLDEAELRRRWRPSAARGANWRPPSACRSARSTGASSPSARLSGRAQATWSRLRRIMAGSWPDP